MRPAVGFMLYNANNLNISLQAGQREKLSLVEIIRRDLHNFIQHVMLVGLVVGWSVDQWSVSPRWDAPRQRSSARSAAWKKLRDKERHPLCLSVPSLMQPWPSPTLCSGQPHPIQTTLGRLATDNQLVNLLANS